MVAPGANKACRSRHNARERQPQCPGINPHSITSVMPMTIRLVPQAITFQSREFLCSPIRSLPIDEQQHENDHHRQQNAVEHLGVDGEFNQLRIRQDEHRDGPASDQQRIEPVEKRRFLEALVYAGFEPQSFAHGVSRRQRQNGSRK